MASEPERGRAPAILSVQLDDELRLDRERQGQVGPGDPALVERRISLAIEALAQLDVRATFFAEGRLAAEVSRATWRSLVERHELGCQGLSRTPVGRLGPERFADDARRGREALQDAAGISVQAFRAPEYAVEGCDPWFGAGLRDAGYSADSSQRLPILPDNAARGRFELVGSDGRVLETPLASLSLGAQRSLVLGSATFRMLPLPTIRVLLERAEGQGFVPQVVLQLSDFDPDAGANAPESGLRARFEHMLRNAGREGVIGKLQQLGFRWSFGPLALALDRS